MNQQLIDYLKQRYVFEAWRGHNSLDENLFIWKFFLSGNELSGWNMQRIQPMEAAGWPPFIQSMWQRPDRGSQILLSVDIFECASRSAAHEFLLQSLGQFQSPLISRNETDPIGDVTFVHPGGQTILFARANLVLMVRNAGPELVPVTEGAQQLDLDLITRPGPSRERVGPEFRRLEAPAQELQVGKSVPLELEASDPLGRPLWFKFFSSSGEIFLGEQGLQYRPAAPGVQNITAFAINAERGAARRDLQLAARQ